MYKDMKNSKGSLTVEACIAFPVFLCFFLVLIFFARIACINITLNNAVNETAKQLAASCYPIGMLNEMEDDLLEDSRNSTIPTSEQELANIRGYIEDSEPDVISKLLTGRMKTEDVNSVLSTIAGNIEGDYTEGLRGYLVNTFADHYFEIKSRAKYAAAKYLLNKFCEGSYVDSNKIDFLLVELPQANGEFEFRKKDNTYVEACRKINYTPGTDDVVIAIEYRTNIPLPFFGKQEVVLRHTAAERAWINGSNGVYTVVDVQNGNEIDNSGNADSQTDENLDKDKKSKIVYVTRTGEKYHKDGCWHLAKSKRPIKLSDALEQGYTACKHCFK